MRRGRYLTLVLNGACDGDCQLATGGPKYKVSASHRRATLSCQLAVLTCSLWASATQVRRTNSPCSILLVDALHSRVGLQPATGQLRLCVAAQLPQTGYHALGTPYSFIGLGRTNNYVEVSTEHGLLLNTRLTAALIHRRIFASSSASHRYRVDRSQFTAHHQSALFTRQRREPRATSQSRLDRMAHGAVPTPRRLDTVGGRRCGGHSPRACLCRCGLARERKGETCSHPRCGRN